MKLRSILLGILVFSSSVYAVDLTYTTTDLDEIAGLKAEADKLGVTPIQYFRAVAKAALQSYATSNGVTDPATREEVLTQRNQLKSDLAAAIAERDALKSK